MKITRRQLRRIIREVSAGDNFTIGRADPRGTDHLFPDNPLNKRDELATQIRHASKDIHGRKDFYDLEGKTMEELEDILYDLSNSQEQVAMDDMYRDEIEDEMGRDHDLPRAEMAPMQRGMGRRPAGSKSQRRMESRSHLKNRLREVIREWAPKSKGELPPSFRKSVKGAGVKLQFADVEDPHDQVPTRRKLVARIIDDGYDEGDVLAAGKYTYYDSNHSGDKMARLAYEKARTNVTRAYQDKYDKYPLDT